MPVITTARLALCAIVVLSAALAIAMLTTGHDWGDDFASYIIQAASILSGTERQVTARTALTMHESSRAIGPIAYPWGFPTALAPMYVVCGGLDILCLKLVNPPFFALFLLAFFPFLTHRLGLFDSALVLSVLAFSPALLSFQNNVLSDIAFLFFSTLSVLLIDRLIVTPRRAEGSARGNVWLGTVLFLAAFVRPNGVLLVATLCLTQAVMCVPLGSHRQTWRRDLPVALIPHLVFGLLTGAAVLLFPSGEASSLAMLKEVSVVGLVDNVSVYAALPVEFFNGVSYPFDNILYGVVLPFMIAGAVRYHRTDVHALIYVGLTLVLYIVFPFQQGLRYVFPVLPFLIYCSYRGMLASAFALTDRYRRAGERLTRGLWMTVLAVFVMTSFDATRANLANQRAADDGPFESSSTQLFDFIRSRTAPADVIIFFKPRAMRLMTDRDALLIDRCDRLDRGDYVAIRKQDGTPDQVPAKDIAACGPPLDPAPVFANQQFVVYRILHAPVPMGPPPS